MPFAIILSQYFFGPLLFLISTFLILLVLVQRGRGGGLTGALGGPGGQSAFGTKAGDIFTRITIVTAAIWIFTAALAVAMMQEGSLPLGDGGPLENSVQDEGSIGASPGDKEGSTEEGEGSAASGKSDSPAAPEGEPKEETAAETSKGEVEASQFDSAGKEETPKPAEGNSNSTESGTGSESTEGDAPKPN